MFLEFEINNKLSFILQSVVQSGRACFTLIHATFSILILMPNLNLSAEAMPPASRAVTPTTGLQAIPLNEEDVINWALENNPQIRMALQDYHIATAEVFAANYEMDWNLTFNPTFKQDKNLPNTTLDHYQVDEDTYSGALSLKKKFGIGTALELVYQELKVLTTSARSTVPMSFRSAGQIKITQPLLKGMGKEFSLATKLKAQAKQKRYWWDLIETIETEVLEAFNIYWDSYMDLSEMKAAKEKLQTVSEKLLEMQIKFSQGKGSQVELLQAQAKKELARAEVLGLENRQLDNQEKLIRSIGPLSKGDQLRFDLKPHLDQNFKLPTVKSNPILPKLQRIRQEIAEAEIDVRKADNSKNIQFDISLQYLTTGLALEYSNAQESMYRGTTPSYQLMIQLNIPLGNETARGEYARTVAARNTKDLSLQQEIRKSQNYDSVLASFNQKRESVAILTKRLVSEKKVLDLKARAFRNGKIGAIEYYESSDDFYDLQTNLTRSQVQIRKDYWKLKAMTGELSRDLKMKFLKKVTLKPNEA